MKLAYTATNEIRHETPSLQLSSSRVFLDPPSLLLYGLMGVEGLVRVEEMGGHILRLTLLVTKHRS